MVKKSVPFIGTDFILRCTFGENIRLKLQFVKYHGTGNDFVIIDNRDGLIHLSTEEIQKVCSRRYGVGSDGLILIEHSDLADFHMNFYNPDASQSFCGNGSRCAVHFALQLGVKVENNSFSAIDGLHTYSCESNWVKVGMKVASEVELVGEDHFVNTGSPHYIKNAKDLESIDLINEAHQIRYNDRFRSNGTNVNFIQPIDEGIKVRTYERGVEGETYSCGTGVTAVALVDRSINGGNHTRNIFTKGGELRVSFEQNSSELLIWLEGPATFVFSGAWTC